MNSLGYRADIDGLRAVAVLSVLLFHMGVSFTPGGYVGVDIFFVISGYLITRIILNEVDSGCFSMMHFYERRCRRILPPLIVVVVLSLVVGAVLLTAENFTEAVKSAIAAMLFSANIFFYNSSGYFDASAMMKPLLHTWTLGVEEQFYLLFPILLLFLVKIDSKLYSLPVFMFISLLACFFITKSDVDYAFYLIPTRAWELLMGSVLALRFLPVIQYQFLRELMGIFGILLIVYAVTQYSLNTLFPGLAALLPVLGAASMIYAGSAGTTYATRFLSSAPFVFVGAISYSLYLWHWPIISYTKIYLITEPTAWELCMVLIVIFMISILSWKFVERPFRRDGFIHGRKKLFSIVALSVMMVVIVGGVILESDAYIIKKATNLNGKKVLQDREWQHWSSCGGVNWDLSEGRKPCRLGLENGDESFILWGDSHTKAIASGVDKSAKKFLKTGFIVNQSGCPPLLSVERPNRHICADFNQSVIQLIADDPNIKTVFLMARWAISMKGERYKQEVGKTVTLVDLDTGFTDATSNVRVFNMGLERTVRALNRLGRNVVLIKPIPEVGIDVPSASLIAEKTDRDVNDIIAPTLKEYENRNSDVFVEFKKIDKNSSIAFIAPASALCDSKRCRVRVNGIDLYRDDDHLSTYGSKYISFLFDGFFK